MRRQRSFFGGGGGQFEPFIKVFEVEQRRRRCCRCAFLRSLRGCIPTGLRLCITAILPAFKMSLKSCYLVCSCCVLAEQESQTLQQKTNPCTLASTPLFHTSPLNSQWAVGCWDLILLWDNFLYTSRNNLLLTCNLFDFCSAHILMSTLPDVTWPGDT